MKRILLVLEYLGSAFSGYQEQVGVPTVQATVQEAIYRATGAKASLTASGRTDAGVHALCQTAHFDTDCTIPPERICLALNTFLPPTVRAKSSREVPQTFHARYDVKRKTYLYRMYRAVIPSPTRLGLSTRVEPTLDAEAMRRAARDLIGTHDFAAFRSTGSSVKDTVRTIYEAELFEVLDELRFTVCGSGFLYNMVRIIVGTLLEIGAGRLDESAVRRALESGRREDAGPTAPPDGLYLYKVEYDGAY